MFSPKALIQALLAALLLNTSFFLSALETKPLPGTWTDALVIGALPDGSLLVAQRSGLVDRLPPDGADFKPATTWADLSDNGGSELLGFAVDPNFLSSGYVYAALRTKGNDHPVVRITRWREFGGQVLLNRVLVDNLPSGPDRAGGVLRVGPDGCLWLGIGDGASPAAQVTPENLRGVLLRYNSDGTIPADNPTADSAVWAWGFRDPAGLAWQPETERLYALDRGPPIPSGTMDRLDLVEKATNYGWPKYVGRDYAPGVARPVIYCSSGHSWIPGGAVFATKGEWSGSLLFAGAGQGNLYRLSLDAKQPTKVLFYEELIGGDLGALVDVALGPNNQLYLLSKEKLYRLNP
jgi:glucose/arabinose dehydrogenase